MKVCLILKGVQYRIVNDLNAKLDKYNSLL